MVKQISLGILSLALASSAFGQGPTNSPKYAVVDYMQLVDGVTEDNYVKFESLHQRFHQKRVDAGLMRAWHMARVTGGEPAQYVTLRLYDSLADIDQRMPEGTLDRLLSDDEQQMAWRLGATRKMLRSELWRINSTAIPTGTATKKSNLPQTEDTVDANGTGGFHIVVDFMKAPADKRREYRNMERNLFQKIHQARVDAGQMLGWWFLNRQFPSGDDTEWNYVTINAFPNEEAAHTRISKEIFENAISVEDRQSFPKARELRTLVRSEKWTPLLRTQER